MYVLTTHSVHFPSGDGRGGQLLRRRSHVTATLRTRVRFTPLSDIMRMPDITHIQLVRRNGRLYSNPPSD